MQIYKKKVIISELVLIILTLCTIKVSSLIDESDEHDFKDALKYILYMVDFGINMAIIINISFQGGILNYYIIRTLILISQAETRFNTAFYVPIVTYYTYKTLCFIQIRAFSISLIGKQSPNRTNQKDNQQQQEIKKRIIHFISLVGVYLLVLSYLATTSSEDFILTVIFVSFLATFLYEIYLVRNSEQVLSKIISNSVVINLYLYIIVTFLYSKMHAASWFIYLRPLLTFLTSFFCFLRISIGRYSDKFHSFDRYLFETTYLFKSQDDFLYFKTLSNENILRLIDNLSRQVALIVYILGFIELIFEKRYFFFFIGIYLINKYKYQKTPLFLCLQRIKIIKEKGLNFHFTIVLPLITSIAYIFFTENEQKEHLFDLINQCSAFHMQSITIISLMIMVSLSIQIIPEDYQQKFTLFLQYSCPLIILISIYNLECLNKDLIFIEMYTFSLCFQSIKSRRLSEEKNEKQY